jgi:hypothetical protein
MPAAPSRIFGGRQGIEMRSRFAFGFHRLRRMGVKLLMGVELRGRSFCSLTFA